MTMHALVRDGAVIERRSFTPAGDQTTLPAHKARWLPVEVVSPELDPVSEMLEGPVVTIEATRVVETYSARPKNGDEIAAMIAAKDAEVEAEFDARHSAPIAFEVGGVSYDWHADAKAVENIMGLGILAVGGIAQNPRDWTPVNASTPVANVNVLILGATIAARRDALFVIKKAKQAAVAAMTDPAEIAAFDPAADWA
jgi:hypothetical protein